MSPVRSSTTGKLSLARVTLSIYLYVPFISVQLVNSKGYHSYPKHCSRYCARYQCGGELQETICNLRVL